MCVQLCRTLEKIAYSNISLKYILHFTLYVLDISRIECTASQETCNSEVDFDVVYTPFVAGSLVWAKVPGYPWYAAILVVQIRSHA